jgi:hypothetical protein
MANVQKIYQRDIKYTNIFDCKSLQNINKNLDFWFENTPSGNPDVKRGLYVCTYKCTEKTGFDLDSKTVNLTSPLNSLEASLNPVA